MHIYLGSTAESYEILCLSFSKSSAKDLKKRLKYSIETKTIHALGKNLVILEIQQSSDVTYRFYDYHRKDKDGKERQLHIEKAIEVTSYEKYDCQIKNVIEENVKTVWKNKYFEVNTYQVDQKFKFSNLNKDYFIVSVIEGKIKVNDKILTLGDSFIITSKCEILNLEGNGRILITKSLI